MEETCPGSGLTFLANGTAMKDEHDKPPREVSSHPRDSPQYTVTYSTQSAVQEESF